MITSLILASMISAAPTQKIAVVKRTIPRGASVELSHVELIPRKSRKLSRNARPLIWQASERLRARRDLRVGSIIGTWDVDPMPDINAGDPVVIELNRRNLRVTANAIAKEDGFSGETIWVQNAKSNRRIRVRVIESGRVELLGIRRRARR